MSMYEKENLSQKVAQNINKVIESNGYQPGDKMPSEFELMRMLNVSRSTVREAIKILTSRGILEIKRGKGTFICEQLGKIKDPLGVQFMEEQNLRKALFEMRLILEPQMTIMAIERGTKTEIDTIYYHYQQLVHDIQNGIEHTESDINFHNAIASATHNPIMGRIIPIINESIQMGVRSPKHQRTNPSIVIEQHKRIMDAILSSNKAMAKEAVVEHVLYWIDRDSKTCQKQI